eukprot:g2129.t1
MLSLSSRPQSRVSPWTPQLNMTTTPLTSSSHRNRLKAGREVSRSFSVPESPEDAADQAVQASRVAWQEGIKKQRIDFLPPLTGATDLDDWPGGIRQMFSAILPSVERFLLGLKATEGLQCPLESKILDEGDAVALWSGQKIKALLFPTSETLLQSQEIGSKDVELYLLINPQWQEGQVISDFGFGRQKKQVEDFVNEFEFTYSLKQYRIQGRALKILRCYPDNWRVFVSENSEDTCIAEETTKPTYQRLEEILKQSGLIPGSLMERIQQEFDFNIKSLKQD